MTAPNRPSRLKTLLQLLTIRFINLYPPYLGAGIRVTLVDKDPLVFRVRMRLSFYNRNSVGTHFGGSLYSMCDPFFMLTLSDSLGPGYVVWDKAATVRFLRPGRGTVHAEFRLGREQIDEIRRRADEEGKVEPRFAVEVVDGEGEVVARVEKLLHVRRKTAA